ncbi:MAG TPA: S8 family serine peptidase [Mycobacteriales bacterium]|nr:S8 family serine peptidase [Mycobacteriales bacterium]
MNTANSGMSGIDRRWWKVAAVATVVALAAAVGIWAVTRDAGDKVAGRPHAGAETRVRTALLAQVKPRPSCPNAPAAPAVKAGQKLISVIRVVNHCLAFRGEVVASSAVPARLAKLRADPGVVAADLPAKVEPARPTTGPKRTRTGRWAVDDLQADQVRRLWPAGRDDVRVAIIDTGVDDSNPDLTGQVVERAPWSHIYNGDKDSDDFHGTHVAGIVAAKDDGKGVLGLTPGAKLLDVQYWNPARNNDQTGPFADVGEDIRWAVDHGAKVLNMSFSGTASDTMEAALLYAERAGVVAVAAAGNCGDDGSYKLNHCTSVSEVRYPAAYNANVLSVANYDRHHKRSATSTANETVDLAAPGDNILSTNLMPHTEWPSPHDFNCTDNAAAHLRTCRASGTSMATPYVSAAAALLVARHPDATPAAIREALIRSTRPAPGHETGVHSDEFGTGLLDPVAAAAYLDQHPGGTFPDPTSSGSVAPDAIVAGYVGADHKVGLTTAAGAKIPVGGVESGQSPARLAFSRDGTWFAAADGAHLAFVNVQSRRQETIDCSCTGVAFNDKGQVLTADGDVIATYEPATASKLHGVQARNTSGTGLPTFMSMSVEGSAGDVTLVNGRFASAGYGAFGVRADGTAFLLGRGEDPGVDRIFLSDDHRWVAWSMQGVCNQTTQLGVADLNHPETTANIKGPTGDGEALNVHFQGDKVVADWAPMQHNSELCAAQPPWPPAHWEVPRPTMGTGTAADPAAAHWSRSADQRTEVHHWSSGEGLYLEPTANAQEYNLTFGPTPGGGSAIQLATNVTDAVAPPAGAGQPSTTPPTQSPASPTTTSSAPQQPPASASRQPSGSPATTDAALARYVKFLHALGNSDTTTICEIAGPAMKKAEAEGIGPCPTAFRVVFQMISPAQRTALKTATVDRAGITVRSPHEIFIPVTAVKASVTFTSEDLGDSTMEYQHGQWYVSG